MNDKAYLIADGIDGCIKEERNEKRDCDNCEVAFKCTLTKLYMSWVKTFNDDLEKFIKEKEE